MLYKCTAYYQNDNQPIAEAEIQRQIMELSETNPEAYTLESFKCVSSEKADCPDDWFEDYVFEFEFTIDIKDDTTITIDDILDCVDSGELLEEGDD